MGSKKRIERIEFIESVVPAVLYEPFFQIRRGLTALENLLTMDFPDLNQDISIPYKNLQQAVYAYAERLTEGVHKERLVKSGAVSASKHPYARIVPNFVKFLYSNGEVGISSEVELQVERDSTTFKMISKRERMGVFLDDRVLGFLDFLQKPFEIQYHGIVPGVFYNFDECYDLGVPTGFSYVRLISSWQKGKFLREDKWKIAFP